MNDCKKLSNGDNLNKYAIRNSPPYSANKCKSMKKKGNDNKYYISKTDKNGIYKWVLIQKNKTQKQKNKTQKQKNKTQKQKKTFLQLLANKYKVTKSGTNKDVANRLIQLRGYLLTKKDKKFIEEFL
jgi:hypothetical protein